MFLSEEVIIGVLAQTSESQLSIALGTGRENGQMDPALVLSQWGRKQTPKHIRIQGTQAVGKWLEDAWSPLGDRGQGSNEITQIPTCHQDQVPLA